MERLDKFTLIFVLVFAFLSVHSLFQSGLPPTHDGEYHVIRFHQFYETLSSGNIYPRWASRLNNGYGLPLFNYVYPLPNYVAAILHFFNVSFIDAFKYNLIIATAFGGLFFYLFVSVYFGRLGGFVGSLFYLFTPYRLVDIYVRGSVGEVWAIAILPLILWSMTKYALEKKNFYLGVISIGFALLIFSHNILSLLFLPFIITYGLFVALGNRSTSVMRIYLALLLGISLSAIFWLPALLEKHLV